MIDRKDAEREFRMLGLSDKAAKREVTRCLDLGEIGIHSAEFWLKKYLELAAAGPLESPELTRFRDSLE